MFTPQQATIVVIDDNASMRESLAALIDTVDYRYVGYASAEDFLEHAPPDLPGCLLVDLNLPGMSGIELQQRINDRRPRLPVVFFSGAATRAEVEQAMADGALDFLHKPFDPDTLLDRARDALAESLRRT